MDLWAEIGKAAAENPTADPQKLAARLYQRIGRKEVIALLAREIAHRQRGLVANIEINAFKGRMHDVTLPALDASPDFAVLFGTSFKLGNGGEVLWNLATLEEHQRRVLMLEKMRAGLDRTIDRHREAIQILETTGAKCLADAFRAAA